jgi:hypothetical protein
VREGRRPPAWTPTVARMDARGEPPFGRGAVSWRFARLCCGRELMTCRSAGVWGSRACRATLPFEGLDYARPAVTRSRPPFFGAAACQSAIERL